MSWDLLGHEWASDLLKKHIAHGELRHAYLFSGPPGIGRRSLALAFASAINCINPPKPGEACGVCRVCIQIAKMQQPDLSIVQSEEDGTAIKVDQIRTLQKSLALSPYESKYRIALLLNFQRANANAQNALLKTLEEAPAKVILLLTADSPDNLLPTISSRCEILRLRPVSIGLLEDRLQNRWSVPAENASLFAHISSGRTGLALQLANDSSVLEKRSAWLDEFLRIIPLSIRDRFTAVEALTRNRDQLRLMLQVWLSFSRDLLLSNNKKNEQVTNFDRQAEIIQLSNSLTNVQMVKLSTEFTQALEMLETNANLRLLLDNLMLSIPRV